MYNRLHSLIFCDHIVEKCHSRRPPAPQRHDDTMHENKFCERPLPADGLRHTGKMVGRGVAHFYCYELSDVCIGSARVLLR